MSGATGQPLVFKNLKTNKAAGPDKIKGKLLKTCYVQLSRAYCIPSAVSIVCGVKLGSGPVENSRNYRPTCSQKAKLCISE